MNKIVFNLTFLMLSLLSFSQEDTLVFREIHYANFNKSHGLYIPSGTELTIKYTPIVGVTTLVMNKVKDAKSPEKSILEKNISDTLELNYRSTENSCYQLIYQPEGGLNYVGGEVSLTTKKPVKIYSCKVEKSSGKVFRGDEVYLSFNEIEKTNWSESGIKAKMQIAGMGCLLTTYLKNTRLILA